MAVLIDGKQVSLDIEEEIAKEVKLLTDQGMRPPHLAAVLVGEDGPSRTYVRSKIKACELVGFKSSLIKFEDDVTGDRIVEEIKKLNEDDEVDGYIVQLPLPEHISVERITDHIDHKKDVDGFTPTNFGKIDQEHHSLLPATPMGIMELLNRYEIETKGKHCVVVGNSHIVGMPMGILLAGPGKATVTICHIHTENLAQYTKMADILVVAVGKANLITADMVKDGVVVIDVGINRVPDASKKRGYALRGDVDFEGIEPKASFITPVPGGVGPMTIASLIMNTLEAYKIRQGIAEPVV
ncbi:MAG: bifunctional 5,10-methylene-tetrahydrofolate dehydrogenase/5,10-methylene-tetrahydrofolate cyclohydrolase [Bacteroidetes bacterium]|nr:MAG: bifunctional 5,10-methylene-tetrahydrofolate dehydrogenase/5,10-methylene-tetrahydrofolate cyclohydrolase [Bacteroidota bacterium]